MEQQWALLLRPLLLPSTTVFSNSIYYNVLDRRYTTYVDTLTTNLASGFITQTLKPIANSGKNSKPVKTTTAP
jgi:hypothetical protein